MARGEPSNPKPTPPRRTLTPATLLECMMVKRVVPNPYKKDGPALPLSVWEPEGDGFVWVRLDIPGANSVLVYMDPNERCIKYKGVEEEISMHGIGNVDDCRVYEGSLFLNPARFPQVIDFTYEFVNGVLLIKITCVKPATSADLGVQVMKSQRTEEMKESCYNPLVSQGTDRYRLHGFNEEGSFVMAIDMPGIGEEDNVRAEMLLELTDDFELDNDISGSIKFLAEEQWPLSFPYGESLYEPRRKYVGLLKVNFDELNPKEAQFDVSHGVLWIQIPRASNKPNDSITIFPGEPQSLEEITPHSTSLLYTSDDHVEA